MLCYLRIYTLGYWIKVHQTFFHLLFQKPYKENTLWPNCKQVIGPPLNLVGGHLKYEVQGLFKCRNAK